MTRPALTHTGADVKIVGRRANGQAVVTCIDRQGTPTGYTRSAWPYELRGLGWHLAEIKGLIARAPLFGAGAPTTPPAETVARPLLSAHYAAHALEREEEHHVTERHPSG